jgi:vitamin B12 transporter
MRERKLALAFSALLAANSAYAQQPPALSGRVTDAKGAPVEAAAVELVELGATAWTDAAGAFRLRVSAAGDYTLRTSRIGWISRSQRVQLRSAVETRVDIQLAVQPIALRELTVARSSARVQQLDRAELQRTGALTVADAVARLPGVVASTPVPGGPQYISIRGSSHDQVLVLVDGVALNDPITGEADLSQVPATVIERIIVIPGAQSARYGGRALGGVLVIETRRAGAQPSLSLGGGSLGLRQSSAVWSPRQKIRKSGSEEEEDSMQNFRKNGREEEGGTAADGGAGFSWSAGGSWRELHGAFDFEQPEELGSTGSRRVNADARAFDLFAGTGAEFAGGALRARVSAQSEERGLPGLGYEPSVFARQEFRQGRVAGSWESVHAERAVRLSFGIVQKRIVYRDAQPPIGLAYNDTVTVRAGEARVEMERRFGQVALGVGADAGLKNIETVTLEAGFRQPGQLGVFTHLTRSAQLGSVDISLNAQLRLDHDRGQDREFLSNSVTFTAGRGPLTVHVAQRTGYSPPALGDQFFREAVGVKPNPALRAERVREFEMSAAYHKAIGLVALDLRAIAFLGNINDLIVWAPDYRFIWSPTNANVLRDGMELVAAGTIGEEWRAGASFTRARIRYGWADEDIQVLYRPRHTSTFTLERRTDRVEVRLETNYTGRRNTAPTNLNALPPFWTTAAGTAVHFQLSRVPLVLQLRIDRLLNEKGALIFGFPQPGRVFSAALRAGG